MADNLAKHGPQDGRKINVNQVHELQYWTRRLGLTEGELRDIVNKVGPGVRRVTEEVIRLRAAHDEDDGA